MNTALYVHVPFCPSGCRFCHFYIEGTKQKGYTELLKKEFSLRFWKGIIKNVRSIHIWGGTPNLLSNEELGELLRFLREQTEDTEEFSIELHPALCNKSQLDTLVEGGINRISFWIQSLDSDVLSHHTRVDANYEKLWDLVSYAKQIWIKKINFDFIYDLIGDSIGNIENNFSFIAECRPSSVYYYRLRRFTDHLKKNHTPNEKRAFWYYLQVRNKFKDLAYTRLNNAVYYDVAQLKWEPPFLYDEIIYASKHKLIGLWVAATSEIENHFTKNICSYDAYKKSLLDTDSLCLDQDFYLNPIPQILNRLYFFLLQKSNTKISDFIDIFGENPEIFKAIEKLHSMELLSYDEKDVITLTEKGHYYFDEKIGDILFSEYSNDFELLKRL